MGINLLVFDLDGTLIDSALDLALSVNATREHAGMGPLDHAEIYTHIGNGAPNLIEQSMGGGLSGEQLEEYLHFFYHYYDRHMLDNTVLYPGVRTALERWRGEGKPMAVLTNKPVGFSTRIIERLGLSDHFFRIYGGNSFDSKKPDPEGLNLIMAEGRSVAAATAMIGDSSVDVLTARNAGVLAAGVTYGLRPESFNEHPPDILCDTIEEVAAALDRVGPQAGFASLGRIPG